MSSSENIIVAPSILAADPGSFHSEISDIANAGADWIHIDVMDGAFVPPITFGDNIVKVAKSACSLHLDVHLMIENPERQLDCFVNAGADRFVVHQEACTHLHRMLEYIRSKGIKNGVALNPSTPAQSIYDVLDICDLVLIMTVNPGWGGQSFIETCLPKIEAVRKEIERRGLNIDVQVDGGINAETGKRCVDAGANVLVAGSYIFGSNNRAEAISSLKS